MCTNISCSLSGGRELLAKLKESVGDEPDIEVRGFECLGACDIAPMVSVDGVYLGPIADDEVDTLAQQIRDGAEPLPRSACCTAVGRPRRQHPRVGAARPRLRPHAVRARAPAPGADPLPPEPSTIGLPIGEPRPTRRRKPHASMSPSPHLIFADIDEPASTRWRSTAAAAATASALRRP